MDRRIAVKHLTWLTGAAALLPGCLSPGAADEAATYPLKHLHLTATHEQLLAQVCETLLPRTTTPGAHDLGLPRYVLKMLDDCTPADEQQAFVAGLGQLEAAARREVGQPFSTSSAAQQRAFLQVLDQAPACFPAELVSCYRTTRQLTIAGYTNSQFFMTREVLYELVPGRYNGFFPVSQIDLAVSRHGQS